MLPEVASALGIAAVLGLTLFALGSARRRATFLEKWERFAQQRGGDWCPQHGRSERTLPAVDLSVGPIVVWVDVTEPLAGPALETTRAVARCACDGGPSYAVYVEGVLAGIEKLAGGQDHELGTPELDRRFVVRSDRPDATREVWTDEARQLLAGPARSTRVDSDGTNVWVTARGALAPGLELDAMIDLAVELASSGLADVRAIAELPGAELVPPKTYAEAGPVRVLLPTDRGSVDITCVRRAPSSIVFVRAAHDRGLRPFSVDVEDGAIVGDAPREIVKEAQAALLAPIGSAAFVGDEEHFRIAMQGEPDLERIAAAARFLDTLAHPARTQGAFR
jgi:hypothetical protein